MPLIIATPLPLPPCCYAAYAAFDAIFAFAILMLSLSISAYFHYYCHCFRCHAISPRWCLIIALRHWCYLRHWWYYYYFITPLRCWLLLMISPFHYAFAAIFIFPLAIAITLLPLLPLPDAISFAVLMPCHYYAAIAIISMPPLRWCHYSLIMPPLRCHFDLLICFYFITFRLRCHAIDSIRWLCW